MGKKRHFSPDVKLEVVQRYTAGESSSRLAVEYSIRPTLVHQWAAAYRRLGLVGLRGVGRPSKTDVLSEALTPMPVGDGAAAGDEQTRLALVSAQRRIAALEQKVGQQSLEIDFFRHALQHLETESPAAQRPGTTASTPSSGRGRSGKAD
jgi:transposase